MFFVCCSFYLSAQQQVVGGANVDIEDYPWQVAVDYGCGGSIIGDSWVLTAAHCVSGGVNYIYAGNSAPYASGGESYSVNQVIVHPNYGSGTSYSHDFALVEINGEFNFDHPNIGKIDLITPGEVLAGSEDPGVTTTITGWGSLSSGGPMASTLQMVETPLVANDVACGATTDSNGNSGDYYCSSLDGSMVCAGDLINGGEDACQGDSGGPLAVRSVLDNRWLLIGATSWGYGCANVNYPGVWSRVSYAYDWITNTADVTSYDNDLSVVNISIDIENCGSDTTPFVEIANVGSNSISGIEIQLFVDDVFVETIVWLGSVVPYQTISVAFSSLNNIGDSSHELEVIIQNDDNATNNSSSIDFNLHQFITGDINLTLYLDQQPGQISWELLNNNEEVLYNGSGYGIALGVESESFNLPSESCYTFNIYDSNGSSTSLSYSLSADGTTISGSGFGSSESINFYVGEISGCTNPMATNFNSMATADDGSCQYANTELCQNINLNSGWSIFSTYITTGNMDLTNLLSYVLEDVIIAKDYLGAAYLPDWNFNAIGEISASQGYNIKTSNDLSFEICGIYNLPEDNPIDLPGGWFSIGYLRLEPSPVNLVVNDIVDDIIIIKDYLGNAFLSEFDFNGIGNLNPGQGYQIKTNGPATLAYLSNDDSYRMSATEVTENNLSHYAKVVATDNNMTVVIEDSAWDVLPTKGAEIAAFDKNGKMVGSAIYSSPLTVVTVWGDDAITTSKDGMLVSESVSFKVWNINEVSDFTVSKWIEGSSSYEIDRISIASIIETTTNVITQINTSERVLVKVINLLGQEVNMDDERIRGTLLFSIYNDGSVEQFVK